MGGTFYRNARTNAVEGQQTAYVAVGEAVAGLQIGRRLVPLRAPRKGPLATAQNRGRAEAHGPHRRLHWEAVQRRVAWPQGDLQACQLP